MNVLLSQVSIRHDYKVTSKFGFYRVLNIPKQPHATDAAVGSHCEPHVVHHPTVVDALPPELVFLVGVEFLGREQDFPGPPFHVLHGTFLLVILYVARFFFSNKKETLLKNELTY